MGTYTGLRCKVIIKQEYREEMEYQHNELGYDWSESNIDFMKAYGSYSRASFIPCGALSYMPDEWEDVPKTPDGKNDWMLATATDGFERQFDPQTGLWTFQCSLKNYESTIEYFFDNVLSKIVEEVIHLEYFYEEWTYSSFFELVDGKIVKNDKNGIKYSYDNEYSRW